MLLNPARPGGSTRDLVDPVAGPGLITVLNKRLAVATARPNPGEPERDSVFFFFFFSNVGFETH